MKPKQAKNGYGQRLYIRKGGRYLPHNDPYAHDGLTPGHWHVWVKPNCTSIRKMIDPAYAATAAALLEAEEAMVRAMQDMDQWRPRMGIQNLTGKELRAWKAYSAIMGPDMAVMHRPAIQDIVWAGIEAVRKAGTNGDAAA